MYENVRECTRQNRGAERPDFYFANRADALRLQTEAAKLLQTEANSYGPD